ncbi:MAG: glycosyltransferase family 4 protein [Gammaproteobacteria bacterium]|nr:glycosyltransferase family 4 protein [Gammaproteobacteria bacterium]
MKVLIWTQYFWPENFRINDVVVALQHAGVSVTVLTGKPNYPKGELFQGYRAWGVKRECHEEIEIIRVPMFPRGRGSFMGLSLNYLSFIVSGYLFSPFLLKRREFDAIFVYAPSPLLQALPAIPLARRKRAPLTVWVQDLWPESLQITGFVKNRYLIKMVEFFVRKIYARADTILIQSQSMKPSVERFISDTEKIHYFPNIFNDPTENGQAAEEELELAEEIASSFSVVFAGNIGKVQLCQTIVAAAELLKTHTAIKFYIIGDGSEAENITAMIKEMKLVNCIMPGQMPAEKMPQLYQAASALLVTLKADTALTQTVPAKFQNYLSVQRPIIASIAGETAKIMAEAKAGIVCKAEDAQALADAVLKLYEMTAEERSAFGKNGYQYFKANFEMHTMIKKLMDYLGRAPK